MGKPGELVDVFGLDAYPSDDWMFACDVCGTRVRADEALRGTGDAGKQFARDVMALSGWRSDVDSNTDLCPSCAQSDAQALGALGVAEYARLTGRITQSEPEEADHG